MSLGVRVTYLPVGQGTANMVEVYEYDLDARTETLVQLYLIDCGGSRSTFSYVASSKSILLKAMALRADPIPDASCTHYLDVLSISHQDDDHYSLFKEILKEDVSDGLKIGKYYRFDNTPCFALRPRDRYTSASFDEFNDLVVSKLNAETDCLCFASPPNFAMNAGKYYLPFFNYPEDESDVFLTALYSNGVAPGGAALGVRRNTLSLYIVLSVQFSADCIIEFHFSGDATVHTMNAITQHLNVHRTQLHPDEMTAPHHGSIISACDGVNHNQHTILDRFYSTIHPRHHLISAGPCSQHGHPHNIYMNIMMARMQDGPLNHPNYYNTGNSGSGLKPSNFTSQYTRRHIYTLCREAAGTNPYNSRQNAVMRIISSFHFENENAYFESLVCTNSLPDFLSRHPRHRDTRDFIPGERAVSKPDNSRPAE